MRRRIRVGVAAAAVLLVLGACSGGSDDSSAETAADATSAEDGGAGSGGELASQAEPVEVPERIVYVADLRLRVDDPTAAADDAARVAEEAGGSVANRTEEADAEAVTLTVRVPADEFATTVDDLGDLGEVLDRQVSAEEVTDQVVDLEGRLANAQASVERLRELFAEARDVNHIVSLEQALTEREAEVESLTGQLQVLEDRADRSTIDLAFTREGAPEVDDDIPGFAEGFRNGWVAFRNVVAVGVTVLGFVLPFLVPVALVGLVGRAVLRRRAQRRPPRPSPGAPVQVGDPPPSAPAGAAVPPAAPPPPGGSAPPAPSGPGSGG